MAKLKGSPLLYEFCVLLCCISWGMGNPVVKIGLEDMSPFYFLTLRFSLALVVFLLLCGKRIFRAARTNNLRHILIISLANGMAYVLGNMALCYADATIVSFLMSISVVFTPLIALVVLRGRIDPVVLPAIVVAVAGLYLICGNTGTFSFGLGELLALLCSVCAAASVVFAAKYGNGLDLPYLAAMQCLVALLLSLPFFLLTEKWIPLSAFSSKGVFSLLFTALFCTCMPFLLQNLAARHLPPTIVSITFVSEPVFTAIFSNILLDETLSASGITGGALIIVGVVVAILIQNGVIGKKRKKEAHI